MHRLKTFRCRFRMNKETFQKIVKHVREYGTFFL
jgi:hypothetical protein